jgi:hypothetical protein
MTSGPLHRDVISELEDRGLGIRARFKGFDFELFDVLGGEQIVAAAVCRWERGRRINAIVMLTPSRLILVGAHSHWMGSPFFQYRDSDSVAAPLGDVEGLNDVQDTWRGQRAEITIRGTEPWRVTIITDPDGLCSRIERLLALRPSPKSPGTITEQSEHLDSLLRRGAIDAEDHRLAQRRLLGAGIERTTPP